MSYEFLGKNIKRLRTEKGYTLEELAKKVGTSHVALSRYERDERKPKNEIIERIARELHVSVDDLLMDPLQSRCHKAVNQAYAEILERGLGRRVLKKKLYFYFQDELGEDDLYAIGEIHFDRIKNNRNLEVYSNFDKLISSSKYSILEYLALIQRNPKAQSCLSFSQLDMFLKYDELFDILAPDLLHNINDDNLPINKITAKINELQELLIKEYFSLELIDKIEILDDESNVIETLTL